MRYTLAIEIDDDVLRASGMAPGTFLRRVMGSLQEYGVRLIEPMETDISDPRETFYFSFGTAEFFPFKRGWVEVRANSREEACEMFASHYPNRDGLLNCSFVYSADEWRQTVTSTGIPGHVCHRVIDSWGPHRDVPGKGLGDLVREAKERLGSREGTKEPNIQKKSPELEY